MKGNSLPFSSMLRVVPVAAVVLLAAACGTGSSTVGKDQPDVVEPDVADTGSGPDLGADAVEEPATPKLNLLSVTPNHGPASGGSLAKLGGIGFVQGTRVWFGDGEASAVTVESLYLVTCTVPAGEPGIVDVKVELPDGTADTLEVAYTYEAGQAKSLTLTAILPESGPDKGGYLCQLTGTGFETGMSVRLGPNLAPSVNVLTDTALTFLAPEGLPGKADVVVKLGEATAVLPDGFEYLQTTAKEPLSLSGVAPSSGPVEGGSLALLSGKGFEQGVQVAFGSQVASVVEVSSSTSMTVEVPPGDAGKVDVVATLNEEVAILPAAYEYLAGQQTEPLSVTSLAPDTGPLEGNVLCVLTGTGFGPGLSVSLGTQDASFLNVLSGTVATFLVPPGEPGVVDLTATLGQQEAVLEDAFTYLSADTLWLLSMTPDSGPVAGGTVCLVKGSGFDTQTAVYLGGKKAEVLDVASPSAMVIVTPPSDGPGPADLAVTGPDGSSAVLDDAFTYTDVETLSLSKVDPDSGDEAGGYLAMLWGTGFENGLSVDFCGAAATDVQVLSSAAAVATVPAGEPGSCEVTAVNPGGAKAALPTGFTYTTQVVTGDGPVAGLVSPKKGPVEGGTLVLVTGQNFAVGATVHFGATESPSVTRLDALHLVAQTPASAPGFADVKVTNPDGKSSVLSAAFQFVVGSGAISLSAITPASGPVTGGTYAVLTGAGFKPGVAVYVGSVPASSVKYLAADQLSVKVPAGQAGPADVAAVNPDGGTAVLPAAFSYFNPQSAMSPPPVVSGVFPPYGSADGGEDVTFTGAHFQQGLYAFVDGLPAQVQEVQGETIIRLTTPPHAAGSVDVAVVNPDGQTSELADGFVYFVSPPFIGSVVPDHGPTTGGNAVTVTGSGFAAGLKLSLDGKLVPGLIVTPPDAIAFSAPPHAEGPVSLTVVNPDGLSASLDDAYTYEAPVEAPAPTVESISPSHGPAGGGFQAIITGKDFAPGATVQFGTVLSPDVDFLSDQAVLALVPKGTPGAWVDVTVANLGGKSGKLGAAFLYDEAQAEPLAIFSVTPSSGSAKGGTSVAVVGSGFIAGTTTVSFGGKDAVGVNVISSAVLTATTPAGKAGPVDVAVKNPGEAQALPAGFLYVDDTAQATPPAIAAVAPSAGPEEGGTLVQVSGTGFKDGATVQFGGEPAAGVAFNSPELLLATTPPHAAGTVSVVVANPDGLAAILPSAFTFYGTTTAKAPVVAAVVPDFGSALGGDIVTLAGAAFAPGLNVYVCSAPATDVTVASGVQLTARVPAGPVGKCDVQVVNPDGLSGVLPDGFTYKAPQPVLSAVVPSQGPTAGGVDVVVYGKNFMDGMDAWFGVSKSSKVTVFDDLTASALVPAGLPGKVDVKVVNPGGLSSTLVKAFEYSANPVVVPPPKVADLIPASGPVAGGTVVNVTGSDFVDGAKVLFGGTPAPNMTFIDAGSLLAVTPPGEVGFADVTVLNPDGQGVTVKAGFQYVLPTKPAPKLFGVVPSLGPESGGTTILVTGASLTGDGMLYIAMKPVKQFAFINASVVSGVTPPGTPGTAAVSFVAGDGQEATLSNGYTYVPAPKIDSLSPELGPVAGGTEITIVGQNFQPGAQVQFGSKAAIGLTVDNGLIMHAFTPQAAGPGPVDVTVTNADGQKFVLASGFTYLLPPVVNSLAPQTGPADGGTPVSIWGAHFVDGVTVFFDKAPASKVTLVNAGLLLCDTPAHAEGKVDVGVKNPDGQASTLSGGFTYIPAGGFAPVLDSIAPVSGPASGSTLVSLSGQNLDSPGLVLMGSAPVTQFVSVAPTGVVFQTPPSVPGKVDVTFISSGGKSDILDQAFTYIADDQLLPPPELYSLTPASGPTSGSTLVALKGKAFQNGATVFFGPKKAGQSTFVSGTDMTAVTPALPAGPVDVTVLNPDGQIVVLDGGYTYVPPPTIVSVSPASGSPQGGTTVTIKGTGFVTGLMPSERTHVHLCKDFAGQVGCEKVLDNAVSGVTVDTIVFATPAHVPGFVDVGVVNPDGQKAFAGGAFYFNEPPVMDSIAPVSGPAKGGTAVTLNGTGFQAGIKVTFGAAQAKDVTVLSQAKVLATTPPGPGGAVDVGVKNPDGTEDVMAAAFTFVEAPVIDKVYPASGPEDGGTQVTVEGNFFVGGQVPSKVFFGAVQVPAKDVNVVSAKVIVVTTPPGKGPVAVKVENPDGQSATLAQAFVYVPPSPPPKITYVIPAFGSGNGGYVVSVIGTGFMDGAQVFFGKPGDWTAATNITVKNLGTMISLLAPPHAVGKVDVRVLNTNQQEVTAANVFEYTAPQQLPPLGYTSINPNRSGLDGGIVVTLAGKGFKAGIKVYFGKEPNWVEGLNTEFIGPTIVYTTVPPAPGGVTGLVDVMLLNPSPPQTPDKVIATNEFGYTNGGVFIIPGQRLPLDERNDMSVEPGDFNNDGLLDVAVMKSGGGAQGEVFINGTNPESGEAGWFVKSADLTNWNTPEPYHAHGDFDGDGDLDIVMKRSDRLSLERNKGDGTFGPAEDKGQIFSEARAFAVADFNCDGALDIFVSTYSTSNTRPNRILVNDGAGNFTHHTDVLPAQYELTNSAAAADVDLDGDVDLLIANGSAMQKRLYYNNCNNKNYPPACANTMCANYSFGGHNYAVCEDTRNWASAKATCEANGYKMLVINDLAEQNFVASKLTGNPYWIGYSDQDVEGTFKWYGDTSTFTYWGSGQPDNGGNVEDCVAMRWWADGKWNDANCTDLRRYVCETTNTVYCTPWKFTDAQYGVGANFPVAGFDTQTAALVDLDLNGYPDAVIGNWGQQAKVYMNYGGNFVADDLAHWPQNESNPNISKLYPADLDADGDMDFVAAVDSSGYKWLRIYNNDRMEGGSGALSLVANAVPDRRSETMDFAVGDFDGDMLPDIYVVNKNYQDQLLINHGYQENKPWTEQNRVPVGKFAFNTIIGWPEYFLDVTDIQAGDIDKDGDVDLVKANWMGKRLMVYINDGKGNFTDESSVRMPETDQSMATQTNDLVLTDLDGDGDLDVAVAGYRGCDWGQPEEVARIRVFINDGTGKFKEKTAGNVPYIGGHSYLFLAAGDLNKDGKTDLLAGGRYQCYDYDPYQRFLALFNGGDPFATGSIYFFDVTATWLPSQSIGASDGLLRDLDGDGDIDLYMGRGNNNYQNRLYYNDGTKLVDVTTTHLPAIADDTRKVLAADFDGDKDFDIYAANWGQDRLHLQEVDHKFADATTSNVPADNTQTNDAVVGDFDGDGMQDVFVVNWDQKNQLFLNGGSGKLQDKSVNLPWDRDLGRGVVAADFDGDGDLDVYVANNGLDRLYINTTK